MNIEISIINKKLEELYSTQDKLNYMLQQRLYDRISAQIKVLKEVRAEIFRQTYLCGDLVEYHLPNTPRDAKKTGILWMVDVDVYLIDRHDPIEWDWITNMITHNEEK